MTDIVEWLRSYANHTIVIDIKRLDEAADEIELLRQVLENARHARFLQGKALTNAANEIYRLRLALEWIATPQSGSYGGANMRSIARAALETREAGVSSEVKHD